MTSREERIDNLVSTPPVLQLSFTQKVERVVAWAAATIAVVALVLGVTAVERTAHQAQCINTNLGVRNAPNDADRAAALVLAQAEAKDLGAFRSPVTTVREKAYVDLLRSVAVYSRTLVQDNVVRDNNPIGKC